MRVDMIIAVIVVSLILAIFLYRILNPGDTTAKPAAHPPIDGIADPEIRKKVEEALSSAGSGRTGNAKIVIKQKLTVNGITYDSIDQVPEPERSRLKETMGGHFPKDAVMIKKINGETHLEVNGITYANADEIPDANLRQKAFDALEKMKNYPGA